MCSWKDAIRVMVPWLALLFTSGCHDFSLPLRQAEPPPPSIDLVQPVGDGGVAGFWRDRVLVTGTHLGADVTATFQPEAMLGQVIEQDDTHLVIEVPDLGDPGDRTLELRSPRLGPDSGYPVDFVFLGPGQPRDGIVINSRTLSVPLSGMSTMYVPGVWDAPDGGPPDGGWPDTGALPPGWTEAVASIRHARDDVVFAGAEGGDFLVPVSMALNSITSSTEFPEPLLATAVIGLPVTSAASAPDGGTVELVTPASVAFALDGDGNLSWRLAALASGAPDQGWSDLPFSADDRGGSLTNVLSDPSIPGKCGLKKMNEARMLAVDPHGTAGILARLLIAARDDNDACLFSFTISQAPSFFAAHAEDSMSLVPQVINGIPNTLSLIASSAHIYLTGARKPPTAINPASPSLSAWRVVPSTTGLDLFVVQGAGNQSIDDLIAYPPPPGKPQRNDLALVSLAVSADDLQMAVSYFDAPFYRVALIGRDKVGDFFHLVATYAGAILVQNLVFIEAPAPRLYAIDGTTGRLIELSLPDLRLVAAFAPPSAQGTSTAVEIAATADQGHLLVSTLDQGLLQFSPEVDSFQLPLLSLPQFGALQLLVIAAPPPIPPSFNVAAVVAFNTGRASQLGRFAIQGGGKPLLLGAGSRTFSGAALTTDPASPDNKAKAGMVVVVSADSPPSADPKLLPQAQFRLTTATALKVATDVAGRLAISSQRCPSDRIAGALAPAPSMDSLWALVWPYCSPWPDCAAVGGAGVLVRVGAGALLPDATPNLCGQVSAGAAHPLWTGPTATSAASLGLLATPDGRAIVRLPGEATQVLCATAGGVSAGKPSRLVFVTADGSASELVLEAPPSSARVLTPAMAADQRPCSTTFKPALYATVQNGIAVFPLTAETADQPCGQPWVPPAGGEGVSCICGKRPPAGAWPRLLCAPVLDGVVAVAPSPNGRALYVVVDNDVERRLVEFDVDRDAQGHVRGLSYLRQASLGKVSVTAAVTPDPAGISFTREGKMAEATVAGEGTIVVIQ